MPSAQAPHHSPAVLILIDVINRFEFPDGEKVLRQALPIAPKLARLKNRAQAAGMSTIYVNDNSGQWRSDVSKLLDYCIRPETIGKSFVEQMQPDKNDYFVLKPMHSGFYQTPLEVLLRYLEEHRQAIEHIRMMTGAKVAPSISLRLHEIARK